MTGNDKSYLFNRDKLAQPIQMKLYQKQKTFSEFFFAFLKSILNFKELQKKVTLILMCFRKYRLEKRWLDECLKSRVSEDA